MSKTTLLTSFRTWQEHQRSNASDDLLSQMLERVEPTSQLHLLRQLPVDFQLAPELVIAQINQLQPEWVLCCGMAESRTRLSLEARAIAGNQTLTTTVNLDALVYQLEMTEISEDAGRYVCNYLYYRVLQHLHRQDYPCQCIFVHVPILTTQNRESVLADFLVLLHRIGTLEHNLCLHS
jgi:pyroglutamyl-peptidase